MTDIEGKLFVKEVNIFQDEPFDPKQTHVSFVYGIVPEEQRKKQGHDIVAVVKILAAGSEEEVNEAADKALAGNANRHPMTGKMCAWLPLSANYGDYVKDTKELQDEGRKALRTVETEEAKREKQRIKETEERRQLLKGETENIEDTTTLEHYTQKRVALRHVTKYIEEGKKRIEEAERRCRDLKLYVEDLDEINPEYQELWEEHYRKKAAEEGIDGEAPPIINEKAD